MSEISVALYNFAAADVPLRTLIAQAGTNAIPYGFYYKKAPNEAKFPYIVVTQIANIPRKTFTQASDIQEDRYRFTIFTNKGNTVELESISTALKNAFDRCNLTYVTYTNIGCDMKIEYDVELPDTDYQQKVQEYLIRYHL
jgi:hypothetical protein